MGKFALLLVTTALVGGTVLMSQSHQTNVKSNERHAERQQEMLAREIARSGYNYMLAAAREYERNNPGATVEQVVDAVNALGEDGWFAAEFQGGSYQSQLSFASPSSYGIVSNGAFADADHGVEGELVQEVHLSVGTLVVPQPSTITATFIESMAGYCSAIYLQRMVPKNNNGHGNNIDGVDASNPGGSFEGEDSDPNVDDEGGNGNVNSRYLALEAELIWSSGKNRNGEAAHYETVINPGTLLNFVLAVDKNCSSQGDTSLALTSHQYDYYHSALVAGASNLDEMQEGKYAMIERNPNNPSKYRIAFEDLINFSSAQHADVKAKGYGDKQWRKRSNRKYSYGGNGWSVRDGWGYYDLIDRGDMPDFSDQVFEIELTAPPAV